MQFDTSPETPAVPWGGSKGVKSKGGWGALCLRCSVKVTINLLRKEGKDRRKREEVQDDASEGVPQGQ